MINNSSKNQIIEEIKIHWRLQLGSYFSSVHDLGGAIYNLGDEVTDYYWNYAGMIGTTPDESDGLINKVIEFAKEQDREPAFYIDPTIKPTSFAKNLVAHGFAPEDEEIWMRLKVLPNDMKKTGIEISQVKTLSEMEIFVDVFHDAYEMLEGDQKTTPYGDSLLRAFKAPPKDVEIRHFVGSISGKPVSIASVYMSGLDAGLYNVGTRLNSVSQGFGSEISVHAIRSALDSGTKTVILQTELGENAERLYKKLGFNQSFSGVIWSME